MAVKKHHQSKKGMQSGSTGEEGLKEQEPGPSSNFVRDCLEAEQLGDGLLFAALHRGRFVFNKSTGEWLYWQGHHWERDIMEYVLGAVEEVALCYGKEIDKVMEEIAEAKAKEEDGKVKRLQGLKKNLWKKVSALRRLSGRSACLEFAHSCLRGTSLSIQADTLDQDPWMLGLPNGVLDLRVNRLRPGRYDDWVSRSANSLWDESLKQIVTEEDDNE